MEALPSADGAFAREVDPLGVQPAPDEVRLDPGRVRLEDFDTVEKIVSLVQGFQGES